MEAPCMAFPPAEAFRNVNVPPLVHPSVLATAAKHCASFGADPEALNGAALAGALLQVHLVTAQPHVPRGGGSSSSAPSRPRARTEPLPLPVDLNSPDLSEAAKQAMKAAQVTNVAEAKKEKSRAAAVQKQNQPPPEQAAQAQAAAATAAAAVAARFPMPPVMAPNLIPGGMPGMPGSLPLLPNMPPHLGMMCNMPPHLAMVPPPMLRPQEALMPPAAAVHAPGTAPGQSLPQAAPLPPAAPPRRERHGLPQEATASLQADPLSNYGRPTLLPPPVAPPAQPQSCEPPREAPREGKDDAKRKQNEEEQARCHLHRKPQPNCKICQRLHFSAKNMDDRRDGAGGDKQRHAGARDEGRGSRYRGQEAVELSNAQTFNMNAMLRDQILKNTYFKSIVSVDTFEGIVDELYKYAETAEVYGAGTTTTPSTLFCCLFRLFTIGITYDELFQLMDNGDHPFVRCCGFLYVRFGCAETKLWDLLGDYCLDTQDFEPSRSQPGVKITMGEYVEALLMDERYYFSALPRIPVGVKKKIEEKVAPLQQYRKRTEANYRILDSLRTPNTLVEAATAAGEWIPGEVVTLDERTSTRMSVRVRLQDGREEPFHLGKVILADRRARGRDRSRSRSPRRANSPDLSRNRGASLEEMVQELRVRQRERAVCSSGKEYARKPIGFMSGLAMKRDMGTASTRLREEETYAPRQMDTRKQLTEEDYAEQRREERQRQELDSEQRQRMQQLFEKYGAGAQRPGSKDSTSAAAVPEEAPDVLRLG
eukprot:TRINITY_DN21299_c0_g2_i1.p1 TRINITY_DN21299_c0_g2~~TRINITY_DN21299_c0_g2_i1.p1  ORF type:complete len:764 (-),score=190.83 TRINITY_DN21299_c0_g2_i1:67-2358(-)